MKSKLLVITTALMLIAAAVAFTGNSDTHPVSKPHTDGKSVSSISLRFTDNGNGTVTDKLTGLMWLKDANLAKTAGYDPDNKGEGIVQWSNANALISLLNAGDVPFTGKNCGYTDWRLPTLKELHSLIHYDYYDPALTNAAGTGRWSMGNPFISVRSYYWSATTTSDDTGRVWVVSLSSGSLFGDRKSYSYYVWPVRGVLSDCKGQ